MMTLLENNPSTKASKKASRKPKAPSADTQAHVTITSTIAVRKGVPMPVRRNAGGGVSKYPWNSMEVGDSFFVAGGKINTFYTLTATARKRYGKNFRAAKLTEGGVTGVGVWVLDNG